MAEWSNGFTGKQKAFIEHYVICLNGVEAARKAGYSGSYSALGVAAHRLLNNAKIREAIDLLLKANQIRADEVLQRLAEQAAGLSLDFYHEDGTINFPMLKKHNKTHLVTAVRPTKYGVQVTLANPQKALEILAKHLNLTPDQATIIIKQFKNVSLDDI